MKHPDLTSLPNTGKVTIEPVRTSFDGYIYTW